MTISAATVKTQTLETSLSGSSGPLGLDSSSRQSCISWQEALEGTVPMGAVVVASLEGAKAPGARGAEDPSLMAIESPTSRNIPDVEPSKTYQG